MRAVVWLGLLSACGRPPSTSAPPSTPSPTADTAGPTSPTTPSDTPTEPTGWVPTLYRVNTTAFGVREGLVVPLDDVDYFGTPIVQPIEIRVRFGDATIVDGPTPDNHCDLALTVTDASIVPDTPVSPAHLVFTMPADAQASAAQCDLLAPAPPFDDLVSALSGRVWGTTVRPLTPDDADALYGTPGSNALGGDWFVDGGALQPPGLTLAWQLDSSGAVLRDPDWNRVPLEASAAWDGTRLSDGLYQGVTLSQWASVSELLEP